MKEKKRGKKKNHIRNFRISTYFFIFSHDFYSVLFCTPLLRCCVVWREFKDQMCLKIWRYHVAAICDAAAAAAAALAACQPTSALCVEPRAKLIALPQLSCTGRQNFGVCVSACVSQFTLMHIPL